MRPEDHNGAQGPNQGLGILMGPGGHNGSCMGPQGGPGTTMGPSNTGGPGDHKGTWGSQWAWGPQWGPRSTMGKWTQEPEECQGTTRGLKDHKDSKGGLLTTYGARGH